MSNKKTSSYQFLLWTLYILSAVIVLVSLCVPVFKLEMGLESEGEWAVQYFKSIFDEFDSNDNNNYLNQSNNIFNGVESEQKEEKIIVFIEGTENPTLLKLLYILIVIIFAMSVIHTIATFVSRNQKGGIGEYKERERFKYLYQAILFRFVMNLIYYALSFGIMFISFNDRDLLGPCKTSTHIVLILQSVIFMLALFTKYHYSKYLKGEVPALNIPGLDAFDKKTDSYSDNLDLLLKYKDLFDNEVISGNEYEEKKKEILKKLCSPAQITSAIKMSDDKKIAIIQKYKELFDKGVISEEEFTSAKKQIMT